MEVKIFSVPSWHLGIRYRVYIGKLGGRLEVRSVSLPLGPFRSRSSHPYCVFGTSSSGWDDGVQRVQKCGAGGLIFSIPPFAFDCLPIRAAIGQTASRPSRPGTFLTLSPTPGAAQDRRLARLQSSIRRSILMRIKTAASMNSAIAIRVTGSMRINALAWSFPAVIKCQYPKQNIPA